MADNNNRTATQRLRDRFFVNFGNYRRGQSWNQGLGNIPRLFKPLRGKAPVVYMPSDMLASYQHPFRLFRQDKINFDNISNVNELKGSRNTIKNAYQDLQHLKTYITSRNDGKLFKYQRCLGWGGNGLAAAFDVLGENGQKVRGVVVKTLFNDETDALEREVRACM